MIVVLICIGACALAFPILAAICAAADKRRIEKIQKEYRDNLVDFEPDPIKDQYENECD